SVRWPAPSRPRPCPRPPHRYVESGRHPAARACRPRPCLDRPPPDRREKSRAPVYEVSMFLTICFEFVWWAPRLTCPHSEKRILLKERVLQDRCDRNFRVVAVDRDMDIGHAIGGPAGFEEGRKVLGVARKRAG